MVMAIRSDDLPVLIAYSTGFDMIAWCNEVPIIVIEISCLLCAIFCKAIPDYTVYLFATFYLHNSSLSQTF
jgi:hypothetical protein